MTAVEHQAPDPAGTCIVGRCLGEPTVPMELVSLGVRSRAVFCEDCAATFPCWQRVDGATTEQLALEFA